MKIKKLKEAIKSKAAKINQWSLRKKIITSVLIVGLVTIPIYFSIQKKKTNSDQAETDRVLAPGRAPEISITGEQFQFHQRSPAC